MSITDRIIQRCTRARNDKNGQALIFVALILFVCICFLAYTINVGHRISVKIEMQNAADAATISGALWEARGLNMISILNVGMTECLALIIMYEAFDRTLDFTETAYEIEIAILEALSNVPIVGPAFKAAKIFCENFYGKWALKIGKMVNKYMQKMIPMLWRLMRYIQSVESNIRTLIPTMSAYEASRIARLNGADQLVSFGGTQYYAAFFPFQEPLPVRPGEFQDLCPPTKYGGSGYTNFLCWDSALDMEMGGEPLRDKIRSFWSDSFPCLFGLPGEMWDQYVNAEYNAVCSGETQYLEYDRSTDSCQECNEHDGDAEWEENTAEISEYEYNHLQTGSWDRPCREISTFTQEHLVDCYCSQPDCNIGCENTGYGQPLMGKKRVTKYYRRDRNLRSCTYRVTETIEPTNTSNKAKPYVLVNNWENQVQYVGVVQQDVRTKFPWRGRGREITSVRSDQGGVDQVFGEDAVNAQQSTYCFACAELYNPTDEDLFNQDWHVKMIPCTQAIIQRNVTGAATAVALPADITQMLRGAIGGVTIH